MYLVGSGLRQLCCRRLLLYKYQMLDSSMSQDCMDKGKGFQTFFFYVHNVIQVNSSVKFQLINESTKIVKLSSPMIISFKLSFPMIIFLMKLVIIRS